MMRVEFKLRDDELIELLRASRPFPFGPLKAQSVDRAWSKLGQKYGFDYMTVKPVPGKDERFFTAVVGDSGVLETENAQ